MHYTFKADEMQTERDASLKAFMDDIDLTQLADLHEATVKLAYSRGYKEGFLEGVKAGAYAAAAEISSDIEDLLQ